MKKLLALTAAALLTGAATAQMSAPPYPGSPPPPPGAPYPGGGGWDRDAFWRGAPDSPRERIQFLQDRIDRGMADGSLRPGEARRANNELNGVRHWIHQMHWEDAGQLGPDQRDRVQARLDQISRDIHWMRHNGW